MPHVDPRILRLRAPQRLLGPVATCNRGKRVFIWIPRRMARQAEDFAFLERLVEKGSVRAIIDRCFPLQQANEAQRYVAPGRRKGHVVLTVDP